MSKELANILIIVMYIFGCFAVCGLSLYFIYDYKKHEKSNYSKE